MKLSFIIFLAILTISGCVPRLRPWVSGQIVDADTNRPIPGAAIWLNSTVGCAAIVGYSRDLDPLETRTDKDGQFGITGSLTLPAGCLALGHRTDYLGILAPGYFVEFFKQGSTGAIDVYKEFDELDSGPFKLDRITYLAEFEHYRIRPSGNLSWDWLARNPGTNWKEAVNSVRSMSFKAVGKPGVFASEPRAAFDEIVPIISTWDRRPRRRTAILTHDQKTGRILGWTTKGAQFSLPLPVSGRLLASDEGSPWLTHNDRIYYPELIDFPTTLARFSAGNWSSVPAQYGRLRTAAYGLETLVTIEADGNELGTYKVEARPVARDKAKVSVTPGQRFSVPDLLPGGKPPIECITAGPDKSLFVVAHSSDGRSLFFYPWYNKLKMVRVKVPDGILTGEVTACAATKHLIQSNSIYLAFRNGGIRQLKLKQIVQPQLPEVMGEGPFWQNAKNVLIDSTGPKIFTSLAVSEVEHLWELVYGVTGDDAIYRFTSDGVPDQRIDLDLPH